MLKNSKEHMNKEKNIFKKKQMKLLGIKKNI